jgi:hypothetical protein
MSGLIGTAAAQYANRPKDEAYADLPSMITAALAEKNASKELSYNLRDLRAIATTGETPEVQLMSAKGSAGFTHWAFEQFARSLRAPAAYLRQLPPVLAASCINHGIAEAPTGQTAQLLVKLAGSGPVIRSAASETYCRLWDADLYQMADRTVFQNTSSSGSPWIAPPTWSGDIAGTWRGDRDSFVIRVDGGSIVKDSSLMNGSKDGKMFRGILIRNSEVGAAAIVIDWVLFQYICGNLNLWGAVVDKRFRRRHVGLKVLRETMRELGSLARQWTTRSASQDEAIISNLITRELATTEAGVIDELRAIGYSKEQAEQAYATCEQKFDASPRSFWGLAQGTTQNAQAEPYQNLRYELDQLSAKLLTRGARLVAA